MKYAILIILLIVFCSMLGLQLASCLGVFDNNLTASASTLPNRDFWDSEFYTIINDASHSAAITYFNSISFEEWNDFEQPFFDLQIEFTSPPTTNLNIDLHFYCLTEYGSINVPLPFVEGYMYKWGIPHYYEDSQEGYISNVFNTTAIKRLCEWNDVAINSTVFDRYGANDAFVLDITAYDSDGLYRLGYFDVGYPIGTKYTEPLDYSNYSLVKSTQKYKVDITSYVFLNSLSVAPSNSIVTTTVSQNTPPLTILPIYANYFEYWYSEEFVFSPFTNLIWSQSLLTDFDNFNYTERLSQVFGNISNYQNTINKMQPEVIIDGVSVKVRGIYANSYLNEVIGTNTTLSIPAYDMLNDLITKVPSTPITPQVEAAYNNGVAYGYQNGLKEGIAQGTNTIDSNSANWKDGYNRGYEYGYKIGVNSGTESPVGFSFINSLTSILSIEILPNFSISSLLTIIVAFITMGLVIKLLKGE